MFSIEGLFVITDRNTFKLTVLEENNNSHINNFIGNLNIIVDNSIVELKQTMTVPTEHIVVQNVEYTYELSNNDNVRLVINCTPKKKVFNTKCNGPDKCDLEVINFYFETQEQNVNDAGFKNKINKFLSLLSYI